LLVAEGDQLEMMATIETATMNYLADAIAVTGAQKQMAHTALVNQIERAGHQVKSAKLTTNKDAIELWKQINEEIWREDAAALAAAVIREPHTLDWARQMLESQDSTFENRTIAQKVLLHDEFPGMTFDDAEECYQVLCKDYGTMRRGVTLQAKAENLDAAKRSIELRLKQCSAKTFAPCIGLPRAAVRAALIAKLGILTLLDGSVYHNKDPRAIAVKSSALKLKNEIRYWLRLQVNETQTPVEVVNKLLKKLGLSGESIARPGARGQQNDRHYQVSGWNNPIRIRLLEAMHRRLSESVSTIS
jgi:hypothetical protein